MKMKIQFFWCVAILSLSVSCFANGDVPIDLSNSGVQVTGTNTIRIRNIDVKGAGRYQADFVWDAKNQIFSPIKPIKSNVDATPKFVATKTLFTFANGSFSDDIATVCQKQFGIKYTWADWSDIVSVIKSKDDLNALLVAIGDMEGLSGKSGWAYFVTSNGQKIDQYGNPFGAVSNYPDAAKNSILGGSLGLLTMNNYNSMYAMPQKSKSVHAICINNSI
jgi:hypothetical protein